MEIIDDTDPDWWVARHLLTGKIDRKYLGQIVDGYNDNQIVRYLLNFQLSQQVGFKISIRQKDLPIDYSDPDNWLVGRLFTGYHKQDSQTRAIK